MKQLIKHMKYLLVGDDGVSTLKSGTSPFDWSLFTDTELDASESDLSLLTKIVAKEKNTLVHKVPPFYIKMFSQVTFIYIL